MKTIHNIYYAITNESSNVIINIINKKHSNIDNSIPHRTITQHSHACIITHPLLFDGMTPSIVITLIATLKTTVV